VLYGFQELLLLFFHFIQMRNSSGLAFRRKAAKPSAWQADQVRAVRTRTGGKGRSTAGTELGRSRSIAVDG